MITLFTKHDIWDMIENKKMSLSEIQEKMGFEDIGQGYGYKSYTAFLLGKIDENYADEYICYIPDSVLIFEIFCGIILYRFLNNAVIDLVAIGIVPRKPGRYLPHIIVDIRCRDCKHNRPCFL